MWVFRWITPSIRGCTSGGDFVLKLFKEPSWGAASARHPALSWGAQTPSWGAAAPQTARLILGRPSSRRRIRTTLTTSCNLDVTKPYEFIGFGAMEVTKPYEFIGFGAMEVTKPYEFIGFGGEAASTVK